jgi:uncharacterized membrane protein YvlD (DUF360 family)
VLGTARPVELMTRTLMLREGHPRVPQDQSQPLNIATLGLFTLVVNGAMLLIVAQLTDTLGFDGGFVTQFGASIPAALGVSVVSTVLSAVLPDGR